MARLERKVAIVTGAGSGLGRASALLFCREGAKVAVVDRDGPSAEDTVREIHLASGEAFPIEADVANENAVRRMVAATIDRYARLDVLFNNAGVDFPKPVTETAEGEWDHVFDVNVKGVFFGAKYAVPAMHEGGSIVSTSSVGGLVGLTNSAAYCASKGAVISLTKALAVDCAKQNIRVNCICPGTMNTPFTRRIIEATPDPDATKRVFESMQPIERFAEPEEVARAALFLASDDSSYLTGSVIVVDGGFTAR